MVFSYSTQCIRQECSDLEKNIADLERELKEKQQQLHFKRYMLELAEETKKDHLSLLQKS